MASTPRSQPSQFYFRRVLIHAKFKTKPANVEVIGTWDDEKYAYMMIKSSKEYYIELSLPLGRHFYYFRDANSQERLLDMNSYVANIASQPKELYHFIAVSDTSIPIRLKWTRGPGRPTIFSILPSESLDTNLARAKVLFRFRKQRHFATKSQTSITSTEDFVQGQLYYLDLDETEDDEIEAVSNNLRKTTISTPQQPSSSGTSLPQFQVINHKTKDILHTASSRIAATQWIRDNFNREVEYTVNRIGTEYPSNLDFFTSCCLAKNEAPSLWIG